MRTAPSLVENGAVPALLAIVEEEDVAHPLLREALLALCAIAKCPGKPYTKHLVEHRASDVLQRIGSDVHLDDDYPDEHEDRIGLGDVAREALAALTAATGAAVSPAAPATSAARGRRRSRERQESADTIPEDPSTQGDGRQPLSLPCGQRRPDGTYQSVGPTASGTLSADVHPEAGAWPVDRLAEAAGKDPALDPELTPLALVSARSPVLQQEIRRRKRYYQFNRDTGSLLTTDSVQPQLQQGSQVSGSAGELLGGALAEPSLLSSAAASVASAVPVLPAVDPDKADRMIANLQQNPHLAATRPPPRPTDATAATAARARPSPSPSTPLVQQAKGQAVRFRAKVGNPARQPSFGLMVDPCFSETLVNDLGAQYAPAPPPVESLRTQVFGVETFVHKTVVLGHQVAVQGSRHQDVTHYPDPQQGPGQTLSFDNVHEAVVQRRVATMRRRLSAGHQPA